MTDELTIKIKGSSWARVTRELDEARRDLKLATYDATQETIKVSKMKSAWIEACRERDEARAECLEQCRLLAMSADRESKLLGELERAKKFLDHSTWVHGVCNPPSPDWKKSRDSQMY